MTLSTRTGQIKPSTTMHIDTLAKQLQDEGKDIINLSAGEPDFDTPEHIKEAAFKAIREGKTKYTAVGGIPPLKKAILQKFEHDNQLQYSLQEVMASNGCKQTIYNALLALLDPEDEAIIPVPYWVSYPEMTVLAQGKPVFIETSIATHFKITAEQLAAKITPKTKVLFLNSPSNPSGMMYTEKELESLAEVLLRHPRIYVISDDIYEHIHWSTSPFKNILNVCPALKPRTVICHGVSKTYAMTGWRIGYAVAPAEIITAMSNFQSQSTSNPNSIGQYAAVAALTGSQDCVKQMAATYHKRHDRLYKGLNALPGFHCAEANGAFYSFPDISAALKNKGLASDVDLCTYLLNEAGLAVVPGSAFGAPNNIRFSYATDEKNIDEALNRLRKVFTA